MEQFDLEKITERFIKERSEEMRLAVNDYMNYLEARTSENGDMHWGLFIKRVQRIADFDFLMTGNQTYNLVHDELQRIACEREHERLKRMEGYR